MNENIKILELGYVNAYLIKTKMGFILIDAGLKKQGAKLEAMLTDAGCGIGDLKLVIITHGDPDHIGYCEELRKKYGVPVAMHRGDYEVPADGIIPKRKGKTPLFKIIMFIGLLLAPKSAPERFKPDLFLEDGQSFQDYGWDARIIYTPGHSKGSVCILTKDGALFAGDTLVNMSKPTTALLVENETELAESLSVLGKLNVNIVYLGHGKPFSGETLKQILG